MNSGNLDGLNPSAQQSVCGRGGSTVIQLPKIRFCCEKTMWKNHFKGESINLSKVLLKQS